MPWALGKSTPHLGTGLAANGLGTNGLVSNPVQAPVSPYEPKPAPRTPGTQYQVQKPVNVHSYNNGQQTTTQETRPVTQYAQPVAESKGNGLGRYALGMNAGYENTYLNNRSMIRDTPQPEYTPAEREDLQGRMQQQQADLDRYNTDLQNRHQAELKDQQTGFGGALGNLATGAAEGVWNELPPQAQAAGKWLTKPFAHMPVYQGGTLLPGQKTKWEMEQKEIGISPLDVALMSPAARAIRGLTGAARGEAAAGKGTIGYSAEGWRGMEGSKSVLGSADDAVRAKMTPSGGLPPRPAPPEVPVPGPPPEVPIPRPAPRPTPEPAATPTPGYTPPSLSTEAAPYVKFNPPPLGAVKPPPAEFAPKPVPDGLGGLPARSTVTEQPNAFNRLRNQFAEAFPKTNWALKWPIGVPLKAVTGYGLIRNMGAAGTNLASGNIPGAASAAFKAHMYGQVTKPVVEGVRSMNSPRETEAQKTDRLSNTADRFLYPEPTVPGSNRVRNFWDDYLDLGNMAYRTAARPFTDDYLKGDLITLGGRLIDNADRMSKPVIEDPVGGTARLLEGTENSLSRRLGLGRTSKLDELEKQYREMAKGWSPEGQLAQAQTRKDPILGPGMGPVGDFADTARLLGVQRAEMGGRIKNLRSELAGIDLPQHDPPFEVRDEFLRDQAVTQKRRQIENLPPGDERDAQLEDLNKVLTAPNYKTDKTERDLVNLAMGKEYQMPYLPIPTGGTIEALKRQYGISENSPSYNKGIKLENLKEDTKSYENIIKDQLEQERASQTALIRNPEITGLNDLTDGSNFATGKPPSPEAIQQLQRLRRLGGLPEYAWQAPYPREVGSDVEQQDQPRTVGGEHGESWIGREGYLDDLANEVDALPELKRLAAKNTELGGDDWYDLQSDIGNTTNVTGQLAGSVVGSMLGNPLTAAAMSTGVHHGPSRTIGNPYVPHDPSLPFMAADGGGFMGAAHAEQAGGEQPGEQLPPGGEQPGPGGKPLPEVQKTLTDFLKHTQGLTGSAAGDAGVGAALAVASQAKPPEGWSGYWSQLDDTSKLLAIGGLSMAAISFLTSAFRDKDDDDEGFLMKVLPFLGIGAAAWGAGGGTFTKLPTMQNYKNLGGALGGSFGDIQKSIGM